MASPSDHVFVFDRFSLIRGQIRKVMAGLIVLSLLILPYVHKMADISFTDYPIFRGLLVAAWLFLLAWDSEIIQFPGGFFPDWRWAPVMALSCCFGLLMLWKNGGQPGLLITNLMWLCFIFLWREASYRPVVMASLMGMGIITIYAMQDAPAIPLGLIIVPIVASLLVFSFLEWQRYLEEAQRDFLVEILSSPKDLILLMEADGKVWYALVDGEKGSLWEPGKPRSFNFFNCLGSKDALEFDALLQQMVKGSKARASVSFRISDYRLRWRDAEGEIINLPNWRNRRWVAVLAEFVDDRFRLRRQLLRRNEELQAVIHNTAHNFEGPMATLSGLKELITKKVEDPSALEYFDFIFQTVQKLREALDRQLDLLSLTREELVNEKLEFEPLVWEIIEGLKDSHDFHEVRYHVETPRYIPFFSNRELISLILRNLLLNASQYRNPENPEQQVVVSLDTVEDQYLLRVSDNGSGISPASLPHIFQMFYRGDSRSQGSGLGLYLVKNAVERLNGEVQVSENPVQGVTFSVFLPLFDK